MPGPLHGRPYPVMTRRERLGLWFSGGVAWLTQWLITDWRVSGAPIWFNVILGVYLAGFFYTAILSALGAWRARTSADRLDVRWMFVTSAVWFVCWPVFSRSQTRAYSC